jgi:hypothetical protein
MCPMFTLSEIKAIKKTRAAASRAYAEAVKYYDSIPDRDEVAKEAALTLAGIAYGKLENARAAMSEVTRQANSAAAKFAPRAK